MSRPVGFMTPEQISGRPRSAVSSRRSQAIKVVFCLAIGPSSLSGLDGGFGTYDQAARRWSRPRKPWPLPWSLGPGAWWPPLNLKLVRDGGVSDVQQRRQQGTRFPSQPGPAGRVALRTENTAAGFFNAKIERYPDPGPARGFRWLTRDVPGSCTGATGCPEPAL